MIEVQKIKKDNDLTAFWLDSNLKFIQIEIMTILEFLLIRCLSINPEVAAITYFAGSVFL